MAPEDYLKEFTPTELAMLNVVKDAKIRSLEEAVAFADDNLEYMKKYYDRVVGMLNQKHTRT